MGTVVSKRQSAEVSESTAVKIRVVAAFQSNCKDNSSDKEGDQSRGSINESASTTAADHKTISLQIKPSLANTKFPKGVYPQRESNSALAIGSEDHCDNNQIQPYRLKMGVLTSSGTQLRSNIVRSDDNAEHKELAQSASAGGAVVQLRPGGGGEDQLSKVVDVGGIPDELDWLLKKGFTAPEIHAAGTVIQKTVRGYQCRRKLAKEKKSAAVIQRKYRQWRRDSSMSLQSNSCDEPNMFIPAANNMAAVDDDVMIQTEDHVQMLKSKQMHSIDENTVSNFTTVSEQETNNPTVMSSSANTNDNFSREQTNSDIANALKEVLNMVVPQFDDVQLPREKKITDIALLGQRTREHINTLYRSSLLTNSAFKIGKEQFKMYLEFQNEIDETMFLAQQKAELCLGESYVPRKVLLISSRVPKIKMLQCAIMPDVITFVYDFERATYLELIGKIAAALDQYTIGAKIKYLGIICKGGPGHLYLFANKPVTPAKLFKDHKMMTFWKVLGAMMSKLVPDETTIHFMESNVDGNKQGEQLLKDLEKLMYPSKVNIRCPLEIGASGQQMISIYFHPPKYRLWKQKRYTKLKLY